MVYEETPQGIQRRVKRKRPGTLGVCALIQNKYGIDAVPHVLCQGFTREETEDFLIELRYLGIDNVLAVRGDDSGYQKPLRDGRSANEFAGDLVRQIADMNRGRYLQADLLDAEPSSFCVGVGGYPEKHFEAPNLDTDVRRTKEKVDAGAELRRHPDVLRQPALLRLRRPLPRSRHRGADHPGAQDPHLPRAARLDPAQLLRRHPDRARRQAAGAAATSQVADVGVEWATRQVARADRARRAVGPLLRHAERRRGLARARTGAGVSRAGPVLAGTAAALALALAACGEPRAVAASPSTTAADAASGAGARPLRVTRWDDLLIRQGARELQHDPGIRLHACRDETYLSLAVRAGERRLFAAELDGPATLVVGACAEGEAGASASALRVRILYADGGEEEYLRELAPGWQTATLPLAPQRPGRARVRLAAEGEPDAIVFVRDFAVRTEAPEPPPRPAKRAILISLDALREDALGGLGGHARTPHLDRLLAESERFHPHWAAEISTKPSHASMLTGLPAAVHGCDREQVPLAEEISTVAERLAAAGAATGAFLSVAPFFHARFRLDQGFDTYRLAAWSSAQELREAADWVAERRDLPFFLFLHLYGAHSDETRLPYEGRGVSRRTVEEVFGAADYGCRGGQCASALLQGIESGQVPPLEHEPEILRFLYDRGVETLDADLGYFFEQLRQGGLWDDTLMIVTADHGEQFGEHGYLLHTSLHEETLRVPLLVKWPRGARAGASTERPSGSIDLAPTLLAHFGLGAADLLGQDLARPARPGGAMLSFRAVRVGDRKLVLGASGRPEALFDLAADPAESRNLLPGAAAEAALLAGVWERGNERARRLAGDPRPGAGRPFTGEELAQLRSLGYLP